MSPSPRKIALLLLALSGASVSSWLPSQGSQAADQTHPCAARRLPPPVQGTSTRLSAVVPNEFAAGDRVNLCGSGLFYTYQANPSAVLPDSRMLRIGDWYLPIDFVAVSNRGERLSFTVVEGGPFQRMPNATTGDTKTFGFVADRSGRATVSGAIALNSLASPPDPKRQHSTDVASATVSVWRRVPMTLTDKSDGVRPSSRE